MVSELESSETRRLASADFITDLLFLPFLFYLAGSDTLVESLTVVPQYNQLVVWATLRGKIQLQTANHKAYKFYVITC